jgi:predicted nuclease with TOPRIM domain
MTIGQIIVLCLYSVSIIAAIFTLQNMRNKLKEQQVEATRLRIENQRLQDKIDTYNNQVVLMTSTVERLKEEAIKRRNRLLQMLDTLNITT